MFWFGCMFLGLGLGLVAGGAIGAALFFDSTRLSLPRILAFVATIVAGGAGGVYLMLMILAV